MHDHEEDVSQGKVAVATSLPVVPAAPPPAPTSTNGDLSLVLGYMQTIMNEFKVVKSSISDFNSKLESQSTLVDEIRTKLQDVGTGVGSCTPHQSHTMRSTVDSHLPAGSSPMERTASFGLSNPPSSAENNGSAALRSKAIVGYGKYRTVMLQIDEQCDPVTVIDMTLAELVEIINFQRDTEWHNALQYKKTGYGNGGHDLVKLWY